MSTVTPSHALQRIALCLTAPASTAALPPTMQVPRRTPPSLSLGRRAEAGVDRAVHNGNAMRSLT